MPTADRDLRLPLPQAAGLLLLGWVRWRTLRAAGAALLHAPLKLTVIVSAWTTLLVGLYVLVYEGLRFLYHTAGLGPFLLDRLWYLFLFVVAIMLAVSQLASAYSTLVRSPETAAWLGLPLHARTICRAKWLESSFYSAWAVLLLTVPVGGAHLAIAQQPLWLLGWLVGLLVPLIAIVTALGTSVLLLWLRWGGRIAVRREAAVAGFVAACGVLFWLLGERPRQPQQDAWFVALQELLPRMRVAMSPWLPSSWAANAWSAGLQRRWMEGGLYGALLATTALAAWRLSDHLAAVVFFPLMRRRGRPFAGELPRPSSALPLTVAWWMRRPFRAALAKDLFLVIRDPLQWSHGVVFFGLLGAYFANVHRLTQFSLEPAWRLGVASLHLACVLLVFGSLAVRFLFPQMSLEGRSLWLLRIAPHGIRHLMLAKLCLYGALAVLIIEGLLWLSTGRLGVPLPIRWWLGGVGILAALALVGLTIGLGAWWIDPSAQDAARVVSSSNGALVLVLMLGYVGCVVGALIVAWMGWVANAPGRLVVATVGLAGVSVVTGWLPVRLGFWRLARLPWTRV